MAQAVTTDHSFAIESPFPSADDLASHRRIFAQYPPGLPLALTPLIVVGRSLAAQVGLLQSRYRWLANGPMDLAERIVVSYANIPITAATVALLALLIMRLGYSASAATFVGLVYGFATFAWGQARAVFPDPLLTLLLLLAVNLLLRCDRRSALAGGIAIALAILVKQTAAAAIPGLLLLPDPRGRPLWRTPTLAGLVLAPLVAAGLLYLLYDVVRFSGGLGGGIVRLVPAGLVITNPSIGIFGLTLSPGKGVFWFALPVVAAIAAYPRFYERRPVEAVAFAVLVVLWLLAYAVLGSGIVTWDGGWAWGPRYLLPALPFALVPLAEWWIVPRARWIVLALALLSALVQIPGATTDFMAAGYLSAQDYQRLCPGCFDNNPQAWRDNVPAASDLVTAARIFRSGGLDLAWLSFRGTWLPPLTFIVTVLLGSVGLVLVWQSLRNAAGHDGYLLARLGNEDPPDAAPPATAAPGTSASGSR
jgi:4-amino-4-deoxy-L-arabinose transferase-like glycosyltransferase